MNAYPIIAQVMDVYPLYNYENNYNNNLPIKINTLEIVDNKTLYYEFFIFILQNILYFLIKILIKFTIFIKKIIGILIILILFQIIFLYIKIYFLPCKYINEYINLFIYSLLLIIPILLTNYYFRNKENI